MPTQTANDQDRDPAEAVQIVERPVEHDDGRRHAEIDEIGEAVELGAEPRRGLEQARHPAVDAVEQGREYERRHRQIPAMLDAHADGGQAGAEPDQRDDARDQHPDRHLAAGEDGRPSLAFVAFGIERRKHGLKPPQRSSLAWNATLAPHWRARPPPAPSRRRSPSGPLRRKARRRPANRHRPGCRSG